MEDDGHGQEAMTPQSCHGANNNLKGVAALYEQTARKMMVCKRGGRGMDYGGLRSWVRRWPKGVIHACAQYHDGIGGIF
jgi:hypothetical protein